jgi:beta-glucosidase/6-phospho-beta-glucosidase/beta-galactosidase
VEVADGMKREEYLRQHLREVQRACSEGVKVIGYVCWSMTSNREWGLKFDKNSDFGLYHIELDTDESLKRELTSAGLVYRQIAEQRTV